MQFRTIEDGKWRKKTRGRRMMEFNRKNVAGNNLLEYILNSLQSIKFQGSMWLVFSRQEEKIIDSKAEFFLPMSGSRPSIFLDCVLTKLKEIRSEGMLGTYVTSNPKIAITDAKPSEIRLAILFERR